MDDNKKRYLVRIHVEQYVWAESFEKAAASTMHDLTGNNGTVAFKQCCICSMACTPAGNIRKGPDALKYFRIEELK
jgi:hypothetical protein